GIYTPLRTGHVGFVGVQHSLGPFLGPISILRAIALFYETTDTLRVTYKFFRINGIKREFSVARTPQQNRVAERKNKTLIEAARTMLADSLLPIPFQHGRMILESVENGPLLWPTVKENGVTRLPPEVYALVSTHKVSKELWERIQMLMQGTSLTKQDNECKLYDEFDKFAYRKGESVCDFYLRFSLLLNDMNIYIMKLEQFQYTSQAPSSTPLSITYPSNDFQLSVNHNVYNVSSLIPQMEYALAVHPQSEFSQPDTGLVVLVFQKGNDPIDAINHMMSFLTAVVTSRYTPTNNQLKTLSNPLQQATINNKRDLVELLGNREPLCVTTVRAKAICQSSAPSLRGREMKRSLRIRCSWFKLKLMDKFFMRRSWNSWQIQG
nr:putative ribonuclease H-like domain-containing protein [Tanacetum cinerariifolium]